MRTLQENQSLNAEYERNQKEREMKEEIERLHSIIKEVREYINDNVMIYAFNGKEFPYWDFNNDNINDILEILDKVSDKK